MTAFFVTKANWPSADHCTVFREGCDVTVGMLRVVKMESEFFTCCTFLFISEHVEDGIIAFSPGFRSDVGCAL